MTASFHIFSIYQSSYHSTLYGIHNERSVTYNKSALKRIAYLQQYTRVCCFSVKHWITPLSYVRSDEDEPRMVGSKVINPLKPGGYYKYHLQ
jgi:hypothetical protein